nr:hypothetical protein [Fodinicola acaciae]
MASLVLDAVKAHKADVVPITQHIANLVDGDRPLAAPAVARHEQASIGQRVADIREAVLASGVQLEGHLDVGAVVLVNHDRPDFAAFVLDADVTVAERRFRNGAAMLCLLTHLVADVFAALQHLVFVEDRENAVHHAAGRAVVNVALGGRDEPYAKAFQGGHHDGVVKPVAGEPRQRIDDDVPHVGMRLEVGNHLLEVRPLVDRLAAAAGVDELFHPSGTKLRTAFVDGQPLRRQRNSLRIVVGFHLRLGRHAEVGHVVVAGDALERLRYQG